MSWSVAGSKPLGYYCLCQARSSHELHPCLLLLFFPQLQHCRLAAFHLVRTAWASDRQVESLNGSSLENLKEWKEISWHRSYCCFGPGDRKERKWGDSDWFEEASPNKNKEKVGGRYTHLLLLLNLPLPHWKNWRANTQSVMHLS